MKKKYIVFGLFAVYSAYGFGQTTINPYTRKKISKSTVQAVYAHYIQNGNHSAVTGGIGTEKLRVYSPEIIWNREIDSLNRFSIDAGIDVVSSASTDKIDFVVSSASKTDLHNYITAGYERTLKNHRNITLGASGYFSIESDYLSRGILFSSNVFSGNRLREYSAGVEMYFDDLRWGRLNGERPLKLVYPVELRDQDWFTNFRRRTFILNLGMDQTINRRMLLSLMPGFAYQQGLLSTPFHRVYFTDNSLKVEKLPDRRFKIPLGIQLNTFLGNNYILRTYYRFYWDNFGILAHTLNSEFTIKISPSKSFTPLLRLYTQKGARFFRKYKEHDPQEKFYTSDYDLSGFRSIETGLEARFSRLNRQASKPVEGRTMPDSIEFRYTFYSRSDGLSAHALSILFEMVTYKRK